MLELFTKKPVFQGVDEINQLDVIFRLLGTPTPERWPGVADLPWYELVKPKEVIPNHFRSLFQKSVHAVLACSRACKEGLLMIGVLVRAGGCRQRHWTSQSCCLRLIPRGVCPRRRRLKRRISTRNSRHLTCRSGVCISLPSTIKVPFELTRRCATGCPS